MILRFKLYSMAVGATAFISSTPSSSNAFTPASQFTSSRRTAHHTTSDNSSTTRHSSLINPDWDNSSYMESLGGTKEQLNEVNEQYYKQAENRAAMNEWRFKQMQLEEGPSAPQQQQQSLGQGGVDQSGPSPELLRKMGVPVSEPMQQMQMPTPTHMSTPPPQSSTQLQMQPPQQNNAQPGSAGGGGGQPQFYDANGNPVSMPMVYDANGNLVPFTPNPPQQQMQQSTNQINPGPNLITTPPGSPVAFEPNVPNALEPPLPQRTKGTDSPRPVGYNADAYAISNTADVYFAQLKQDSKVRKIARLNGDLDTANQVFGDKSVEEIGNSWNTNPYTREKNMQEARAQIEGAVRMQVATTGGNDEGGVGSNFGQVSYREKLAQMKAKRSGGGGESVQQQQSPKVASAVQQQPKMEPPKVVQQQPSRTKVVEEPTVNVGQYNSPPKLGAPFPPQSQSSQSPTKTISSDSQTSYAPPKEQEDLDAEALARGGGYGLAAGTTNTYAIPGMDEMSPQEYRDKLQETVSARQAERRKQAIASGNIGNRSSTGYLDGLKKQSSVLPQQQQQPAPQVNTPTSFFEQEMSKLNTEATTSSPSPPPARSMPPRSAATPVQAQAATMISTTGDEMNDPLAGSVAVVEAALKMYKDSSPEDRDAMLIPLREALLAATSASNRIMAETTPTVDTDSATTSQPMMGFPTSYEVTQPVDEEAETTPPPMVVATSVDKAENDKKLKEVYDALEKARGDGGKLGLKNMSPDEANGLIDKIVTMRSVLLDELN